MKRLTPDSTWWHNALLPHQEGYKGAAATLVPIPAGSQSSKWGASALGHRRGSVTNLFYYEAVLRPQSVPSARSTASGVMGCAVTRAPSGASASFTAFRTAPGAPAVPASPAPLKPPSA